MADALEFLDNLNALNFKEIAVETIEKNKEVFADYNAAQLAQGIRSDGTSILPEYTDLTKQIKKRKSGLASITDRITTYDTGRHYKELYTSVIGDEIEHGSRDEKSKGLEKKYATAKGSLYGPTEESQEEIVEDHLRPDYYEATHNKLGL